MIADVIAKEIVASMKAHNAQRTETLRLIKAELLKAEVADRKAYSEEIELQTLQKMVNAHRDSIEQFKAGDRPDLVEKEEAELKIIQEFAPKEATIEEITQYTEMLINMRIQDVGSVSMKDMGSILSNVRAEYPSADGKLVSSILKKHI